MSVFSDDFAPKGDDEKDGKKESDSIELRLTGPLNKIGQLIF